MKGLFIKIINKPISAFSLIELVIVMALSGIVMGMVYYSYHITQMSFMMFNENRREIESYYIMTTNLERDFFRADSIIRQDSEIRFHIGNELLAYDILETGIIRHQNNMADSLNLVIEEFSNSFKDVNIQNGWIDELIIIFRDEGAKNTIHFYKQYDALTMVSHKE